MAMPESQLETWANQGSINEAKSTADSVKSGLKLLFFSRLIHLLFFL